MVQNTLVIVTGGFDPLHSGHIEYFKEAKKLGDLLIVGINSDEWLTRKKGRPFMPYKERLAIIESLRMVDAVVAFDDSDDTSCGAIFKVMSTIGHDKIIFANGGDRKQGAVPEENVYADKVEFVYGVGGNDKKNSSSWILEEWKNPKTIRPWGWYRVLEDKPGYKVKELVIEPGKRLSYQRHFKRAEHWYILKGKCILKTKYNNIEDIQELRENRYYDVKREIWHQGSNKETTPCHILEVQYGDECIEEDIERIDEKINY